MRINFLSYIVIFISTIILSSPAYAAVGHPAVTGSIPFKADTSGGDQIVLKVFGSLVLVSVLGVAIIYLIKRYLPAGFQSVSNNERRLKLIEMLRLTPKTTLFLVELDGKTILIAQSPDNIVGLDSSHTNSAQEAAD